MGNMQDPTTVEQQNGACIALEGRTFTSVDELECGRSPDGTGRCHWLITFAIRDNRASDFAWSYSDVAESGKVECHGETLAGIASRSYTGAFDPATQTLTWAGAQYLAQ